MTREPLDQRGQRVSLDCRVYRAYGGRLAPKGRLDLQGQKERPEHRDPRGNPGRRVNGDLRACRARLGHRVRLARMGPPSRLRGCSPAWTH